VDSPKRIFLTKGNLKKIAIRGASMEKINTTDNNPVAVLC
jgi:hypothetical protein